MIKKILVVDDQPNIVMLIANRLKSNGYDVICAKDGIEALEKANEEKPALILLDIAMPNMNGYEALTKLKESSETDSIPVIMLTANDQPDDIAKAANLGATDYIAKPFDHKILLEKISNALG